jgi:hypothetical protein
MPVIEASTESNSRIQDLQVQLALTEPKTHKAYADGEGAFCDVMGKLVHFLINAS